MARFTNSIISTLAFIIIILSSLSFVQSANCPDAGMLDKHCAVYGPCDLLCTSDALQPLYDYKCGNVKFPVPHCRATHFYAAGKCGVDGLYLCCIARAHHNTDPTQLCEGIDAGFDSVRWATGVCDNSTACSIQL